LSSALANLAALLIKETQRMTNKNMTIPGLAPYALGVCTVIATLAGCGGSQINPPGATQGVALQRNGAMAVHPDHSRSWMAPQAKSDSLLYISDLGTNAVYVFSYPKGTLVGTLAGFAAPFGECVGNKGDVFIANYEASNIIKYAHGGTSPIATLSDPGYFPGDCAVDPTTGNLAVTNLMTTGNGQGTVAIYKDAAGKPTAYYTDPVISRMAFCGYDKAGNLFVDGLTSGNAFAFAELPKGSKSFRKITLNQHIETPDGMQWDGTHMAVEDGSVGVIYRFAISGTKGTEVGTTPLVGSANVLQFWIDGPKVVGANNSSGTVTFWNYPAGGSGTKTITGLVQPLGVTVSTGG
jgi:hypothetical protein